MSHAIHHIWDVKKSLWLTIKPAQKIEVDIRITIRLLRENYECRSYEGD